MRYITTIILALLIGVLISCEKKEDIKPPSASFAVSPGSGPITTNFSFDANGCSDPADPLDMLQVRWDWDSDGAFDTEFSPTKVVAHRYEDPGYYTATMEVINTQGWTDHDSKSITVYADSVPPTASFFVDPDTSSVNTIFLFNAAESSDHYTPVGELEFRWDWNNDGVWDRPYAIDSIVYHKYEVPGRYRILMEVKNNLALTDTISRMILVEEF